MKQEEAFQIFLDTSKNFGVELPTEKFAFAAFSTGWRLGAEEMVTPELILHILKAYKLYLYALTECGFDANTAQYIKNHWDEDYDLIEGR